MALVNKSPLPSGQGTSKKVDGATSVDIWTLSKNDICQACLDGNYENCYCTTTPASQSPNNFNNGKNRLNNRPRNAEPNRNNRDHLLASSSSWGSSSVCSGEFISDNEFEDFVELDLPQSPSSSQFSVPSFLPPSRTDWRRIESVLSDTIFECEEPVESPTTPNALSFFSSSSVTSEMRSPKRSPGLQMTFVDSESDKDSIPDVEVYYEDDQNFLKKGEFTSVSTNDIFGDCLTGRDLDSRDSGFVTSDMYETSVEYVTDDQSEKRRGSLEPAEISSMMLASLQLHEEVEKKKLEEKELRQIQLDEYRNNLLKKSVEELLILKEELELTVVQVNLDLVKQLSMRDELHSHHQSLLMNADDIAKSESLSDNTCQNNNDITPTNSPSKKPVELMSPKKEKRRSWWFR